MKDKTLQSKAIELEGENGKKSKYILVADRVAYFNEQHTKGSIRTERLKDESGIEIIKATIVPDISVPERYFTGHSQADKSNGEINKYSALENAETSAIGRALGFMGIGIVNGLASLDEIVKNGKSKLVSSNSARATIPKVGVAKPETEDNLLGVITEKLLNAEKLVDLKPIYEEIISAELTALEKNELRKLYNTTLKKLAANKKVEAVKEEKAK